MVITSEPYANIASSFPKAIQVCVGQALVFLIVDVHEQCNVCQVRRRPSCSGSFAWLGSHPSLGTRKDATVEVVLATCHKCCFKLCLLFGPNLCQHLYSKRQLSKNHNLGQPSASRV